MKQIIPEIKARVFALYLSNQLYVESMPDADLLIHGVALEDNGYGISAISEYRTELTKPHLFDLHDCKLWLRDLSTITDEDAIELNESLLCMDITLTTEQVRNVVVFMFTNLKDNSHKVLHQQFHPLEFIAISDHLRSKGYALPAFGYSVDELVQAGVFRLKEVNND